MSSTADDYTPPKVWTWNKASGGRFANINRPISAKGDGATFYIQLPAVQAPNS